MADRLSATPDPSDPEIASRAAEPLLSYLRDNLSTQRSEGRTFTVPEGRPNDHQIRGVVVSGLSAELSDCFIDGRAELDSQGQTIDDAIVSKLGKATLVRENSVWKVSGVQYSSRTAGASGCGD